MKSNIVAQVACIISCAALFFLAAYFGKAVDYLDVALFVIGLCLGVVLLALDEKVLHKYYADESKQTNGTEMQTNDTNMQTEGAEMQMSHTSHQSHTPLVTRSLLFICMLFPLGLFLLTSTGSALGVGTFLGIILGLSLELFSLRTNQNEFKKRFLYQLKRDITPEEQKAAVTAFVGLTALYAFFVIFLGR